MIPDLSTDVAVEKESIVLEKGWKVLSSSGIVVLLKGLLR